MDEVLAVGVPYFDASKRSPRFTHLMLTGGAIRQGPSAATGAAIASPNRKVINFQSDGCGAYSVQALWTEAAKSGCGNNHWLQPQLSNSRLEVIAGGRGPNRPDGPLYLHLDNPLLDWVKIGEVFGVPSVAVDSAAALARELERALTHKGPHLIEAITA